MTKVDMDKISDFEFFNQHCKHLAGAIQFSIAYARNIDVGSGNSTVASIELFLDPMGKEGYFGVGEVVGQMPGDSDINLAFVRAVKSACEQAERDILSVVNDGMVISDRIRESIATEVLKSAHMKGATN